MLRIVISTLFIFLFSTKLLALVELGGSFGYDKTIFGVDRTNSEIKRTYSGMIAFYLWDRVALEFNYSESEDLIKQKFSPDLDEDYSMISLNNTIDTQVFGAGLRFSLTNKKSRIVPMFSLGYAKQLVKNSTDYTFYITDSDSTAEVSYRADTQKYNSVFGSFILQLRLTQRFMLKASIKTFFPAFEFDKARDSVNYLVGFTWYL